MDKVFTPKPVTVLYAYGQHGDHISKLQKMTKVKLYNGVPDDAIIDTLPPYSIVVFDDLM